MLPVRAVNKVLKGELIWDGDTHEVKILKGDRTILEASLKTGKIMIDGEPGESDTSPEIKHGRTFIPVREIDRLDNVSVEWNSSIRKAKLTSSSPVRFAHEREFWLQSD